MMPIAFLAAWKLFCQMQFEPNFLSIQYLVTGYLSFSEFIALPSNVLLKISGVVGSQASLFGTYTQYVTRADQQLQE